jgi:hypothetical protein
MGVLLSLVETGAGTQLNGKRCLAFLQEQKKTDREIGSCQPNEGLDIQL